jgi:hypothetical protein
MTAWSDDRRWAHAVALAAATMWVAVTPAIGGEWDAGLRAAIADLTVTFGPEYPRGAEFLRRLDALDANNSAALKALRREALLANPLLARQDLLFVARRQFAPDHHNTETFFQAGEVNTGSYRPGGALKRLDVASGRVTVVLDAGADGLVRDPELSFDGSRIIFSFRSSRKEGASIWEIRTDGGNLRRLTNEPEVNDIDPVYLPDGGIVFTSTREPKYCMCNRHIMGNLFRMESDGANIHQIGRSTLFEGHPTLLADGRILYDRWEYVDRNFGDGQSLWTTNPDGTAHAIYWGSNVSSPGAVIDAREVPGSELCVAVFAACHDRPWGALALLDRQLGVDRKEAVLHTWPASAKGIFNVGGFDSTAGMRIKYEDPYPLSPKYFLASRMVAPGNEKNGIYLLDVFGNEVLVHSEDPGCFDPMPVAARPLPAVIPTRRDFTNGPGKFYVQDASFGTHMAGVKKEDVRYLRVVESPEKRSFTQGVWGGQGAQLPAMNWHNFENKRILGTVPVEADGSAYFEVPSDRFVFFQVLDKDKRLIQSMRSGTIVQSGETQGCVGCHEDRTGTAAPATGMLAMRKPPVALDGWFGPAREFSFRDDVQPVFDRHCVSCHDFANPRSGGLVLAGDREVVFNAAYTELWSKGLIRAVGAGPAAIQAARSWGSGASRLVAVLDKGHYDVRLNPEEMERLVTWIDLNAPYFPTYESAFPEGVAGRSPLTAAQSARVGQLAGVNLSNEAQHGNHRLLVSFDRPELSPLLARLPPSQTAARAELIAILEAGRQAMTQTPRGDGRNFTPCAADLSRNQRYQRRAEVEDANRAAIRDGRKRHDGDPLR